MRTGAICASAVAVAAICTAALIRFDFVGSSGSKPAAPAAPVAAADTGAPPVRRVAVTSIPAAPPAPEIPAPPTVAAAPPAPRPAPVETTGSISPAKVVYVSGSRVALRSGPDAGANLLTRLAKGVKLSEIARENGWVKVRDAASNTEGWISASLAQATPVRD